MRVWIVCIVNVAVFDVPPPGPGLTTVMLPWPPKARSATLTLILICWLLTYVVGRLAPFHCACESAIKLLPLMLIVSCLALARSVSASVGLTPMIDGVGFSPGLAIVNSTAFDRPPPGPGLNIATPADPPAAMSAAPIWAVSWLPLTKLMVRSDPFQRSFDPAMKFSPLMVSVNAAPPAWAELGARLVSVGMGLATLRATTLLSLKPVM